MKITVSYPPIPDAKAEPMLGQQRQFQYFEKPTFNLPVIPATLATNLDVAGYDVTWDDSLAEQRTYTDWLRHITNLAPDVMFIESKTPVIKKHWGIISDLKRETPSTRIVLMGDHPTSWLLRNLRMN